MNKEQIKVTGTIKLIGQTEQVTEKFKKRQMVLTTDEKYPQELPIDFVQNDTAMLDSVNVGDNVTVYINLRGREWKDKYFCNINGWNIEIKTTPVKKDTGMSKEETDLPF